MQNAKRKKGIFFTIDSILAAGIVFIAILLASSVYVDEPANFNLGYLSNDILKTLSELEVGKADNEYARQLIADGTITNLKNTVLEQIIEFWSEHDIEHASKIMSNVTAPLFPSTAGFGLWLDGENIYEKNVSNWKSLVSSKKLVSAMGEEEEQPANVRSNPPKLLGPVMAEVRAWQ